MFNRCPLLGVIFCSVESNAPGPDSFVSSWRLHHLARFFSFWWEKFGHDNDHRFRTTKLRLVVRMKEPMYFCVFILRLLSRFVFLFLRDHRMGHVALATSTIILSGAIHAFEQAIFWLFVSCLDYNRRLRTKQVLFAVDSTSLLANGYCILACSLYFFIWSTAYEVQGGDWYQASKHLRIEPHFREKVVKIELSLAVLFLSNDSFTSLYRVPFLPGIANVSLPFVYFTSSTSTFWFYP